MSTRIEMAEKLVRRISDSLCKFENTVLLEIFNKLCPGLCTVDLPSQKQTSIPSTKDDGFLWGVPKHRRSVEKRWSRKFGFPKYNWKPLVPKSNLKVCRACGHFHESFTICGHCYAKVRDETKEMQEIAAKENKLSPVKAAVVFMYEGESNSSDFWKGQKVLEVPKKRPSWFHQNLLESSNQNQTEKSKQDLPVQQK